MATFMLEHGKMLQWAEVVIEMIELGQRLGRGWMTIGDITVEADAILSTHTGGKVSISGLEWAEWVVSKT